jgi:hypothetical protein
MHSISSERTSSAASEERPFSDSEGCPSELRCFGCSPENPGCGEVARYGAGLLNWRLASRLSEGVPLWLSFVVIDWVQGGQGVYRDRYEWNGM